MVNGTGDPSADDVEGNRRVSREAYVYPGVEMEVQLRRRAALDGLSKASNGSEEQETVLTTVAQMFGVVLTRHGWNIKGWLGYWGASCWLLT